MSLFALNIGNTHTGIALLKDGHPIDSSFVLNKDWNLLEKQDIWTLLKSDPQPLIAVSSVAPPIWRSFQNFLKKKHLHWKTHMIHHNDQPNLHLAYNDPNLLGCDRLVLIHHAQKIYPKHLVMIVDAGTVLSIDVIIQGKHQGGRLSSGMHLSLSAMNQKTAFLPHIKNFSAHHYDHVWGKNTTECLLAGVFNEKKLFIQNTLQEMQKQNLSLKTISWITGGDSLFFQSILPWNICDPLLIFQSIFYWCQSLIKL